MSYLERYNQGECEAVWSELVALGDAVNEGPLLRDAWAVAMETMARVNRNVDILAPRLRKMGYRFGDLSDAPGYWKKPPVHKRPTPLVGRQIQTLEKKTGPLPLSLKAFWSMVGGVNFIGYHPDWPGPFESDPLYIDSLMPMQVKFEYESWSEAVEDEGLEEVGPFCLPLSADVYHKANISGGAPYGIHLPCGNADAKFEFERHDLSFVEYLRLSFRWGGFPGWDALAEGDVPAGVLSELREGLVAI